MLRTDNFHRNTQHPLEQDEKDVISQDNVIESRPHGAKPPSGYQEPGDEEGLGGNDGRSQVAGGQD